MNLHEYQGKNLLKEYGVAIQDGVVAHTLEEAVTAYNTVKENSGLDVAVVKAQIHAGGRGKGGGVKLVKGMDELKTEAGNILGMMLKTPQTPGGMEGPGKKVNKILIAEDAYAPDFDACEEYYVSILMDRGRKQNVIIYSTEGGMDIETVAEETPHLVHKEYVDPTLGLQGFQLRKIAFNLGLSGKAFKEMCKFISNLYKAFIGADAAVGCMVNGAGLAMATMDIIKLSGGSPANFLDVGGTADAARVEQAFRIILKDPEVKAILINIFGGIVRCDRVAQGVVDAYKNMGDAIKVPIIVRLQGTNADIAKDIIDNSGLEEHSAIQFQEAADLGKKELA